MEWLTNPQAWIGLVTLTALEIVLGIDNIIFISVLVSRLPHKKRDKARIIGLGLAMLTRIDLLLSITWVMPLLDIIFSLDSVITAVGLANDVEVMVVAIVLAVIVMMLSSRGIGEFVDKHPTIKILALSFLVVIGVTLFAEGFDFHVPKGYIYFAMAFSVTVEMLNLKMRKKAVKPVTLRKSIKPDK